MSHHKVYCWYQTDKHSYKSLKELIIELIRYFRYGIDPANKLLLTRTGPIATGPPSFVKFLSFAQKLVFLFGSADADAAG